jgi:hypothetical protein
MNNELEQYRKQCIVTLQQNAGFIRDTATDVLGRPCKEVFIIGSVLDSRTFNESSDVDVAVVVEDDSENGGVNEGLSEKLQNEMQRYPLGEIGVVNTLVFVNEMHVKSGKLMKIADAAE